MRFSSGLTVMALQTVQMEVFRMSGSSSLAQLPPPLSRISRHFVLGDVLCSWSATSTRTCRLMWSRPFWTLSLVFLCGPCLVHGILYSMSKNQLHRLHRRLPLRILTIFNYENLRRTHRRALRRFFDKPLCGRLCKYPRCLVFLWYAIRRELCACTCFIFMPVAAAMVIATLGSPRLLQTDFLTFEFTCWRQTPLSILRFATSWTSPSRSWFGFVVLAA